MAPSRVGRDATAWTIAPPLPDQVNASDGLTHRGGARQDDRRLAAWPTAFLWNKGSAMQSPGEVGPCENIGRGKRETGRDFDEWLCTLDLAYNQYEKIPADADCDPGLR
jgi:hypothetical protein